MIIISYRPIIINIVTQCYCEHAYHFTGHGKTAFGRDESFQGDARSALQRRGDPTAVHLSTSPADPSLCEQWRISACAV
jgi:hypothetical protein